jgi:DNA polymerase III subunit epsilon
MMREIVFDTETTGVNYRGGDRVIEIGMVELFDLIPTGNEFHVYINPTIPVPLEAQEVHGLTNEFLKAYPTFEDPTIVDAMIAFIGDDPLVAHNAEFDRGFLNAELKRLGRNLIPKERCIDTLVLARKKFPGAPASLDALCRRFAIDTRDRTKHGALIDSYLLAGVYLELMGGAERRLALYDEETENTTQAGVLETALNVMKHRPRPVPLAPRLSALEREAHQVFLSKLSGGAIWNQSN